MRLNIVKRAQAVGDVGRHFWGAFTPHAPVAQACMDRSVTDSAGHSIFLPPENITRRAGAVVEWIRVLHKGGFGRVLAESFHADALPCLSGQRK